MSSTMPHARSVAAALSLALATGSRHDVEQLLTEDVRWHGEDDAECHGRATAGQFYAEITAQGALLVDDIVGISDPHASHHSQGNGEGDGDWLQVAGARTQLG